MPRLITYRLLCGLLGITLVAAGLLGLVAFFGFHAPGSELPIHTGPVGFYFVGFAGCALVAWGGCLLGAARRPAAGRSIGTATAAGLILCALMRIAAWIVGDYHVWPGELLRAESAAFLVLALAFVWLRPPVLRPGAA